MKGKDIVGEVRTEEAERPAPGGLACDYAAEDGTDGWAEVGAQQKDGHGETSPGRLGDLLCWSVTDRVEKKGEMRKKDGRREQHTSATVPAPNVMTDEHPKACTMRKKTKAPKLAGNAANRILEAR